ncbi:ABC transporter permease [Sporosarcina koreensis]|uniref:ABC transporter permease n=1 Tax=Sporosarcina koreensis TaxID=334735 RepID=UPI00058B8C35|nr:ABC transporter permease [Sporosarcina koreensis]
MSSQATGSMRLFRFIVRRDWLRLVIWIAAITAITVAVPPAFQDLYPTQAARDAMAETMKNPAMTAMVGPGNLDHYTLGAMTTHQMLLLTAVAVAIMNILLAVRFTRAEEEAGISEMLLALPVGRRAPLLAAAGVLAAVNFALAAAVSTGLASLGMDSLTVIGSMLYGLTLGGAGLLFASVALIAAQLSESARGATGLAMITLVLAFLIRAAGDAAESRVSWLSPLGWVTAVQPFAGNHPWPLALLAIGGILLFGIAWALQGRRDLGAGLLHARQGRTHASKFLQTPLGLVLRLQRTAMITWGIGMLVLGLAYGSVLGDLESFFDGNELLQNMLTVGSTRPIAEQFLPMLMLVMALIATIPAILSMQRLLGEEKNGRIDSILGRPVSRVRLIGTYLTVAGINGIVMNSLAAAGLWLASHSAMATRLPLSMIMGASAVQIPAILVLIALCTLLIGALPKASPLIWIVLVYSFVVLYLGSLFQLPAWMAGISPFGSVPAWPVEEMDWVAVVELVVVGVIVGVGGVFGYRERNIG